KAVAQAAFQAAHAATALIDLRTHQGGHPRVGAIDVVPFVPIRGVTMDDCVALAKRVGERIGQELKIPVFLYERAATHPDRTNLEAIRKGGPEGLAGRMLGSRLRTTTASSDSRGNRCRCEASADRL
ncbi:MAG: hypothetical protein C4294_06575, partial [Nitrospiraceae bacterium]